MANETKTIRITSTHFSKSPKLTIEEQKSNNIKIDKLLANASKKGAKQGRPDFIIQFNDNKELLIVIECKAKITKHSSSTKDQYSEFAVDGVLLYASFLAKEYDVLAIAISGETEAELKVSHFLHLKGEKQATPIFGDTLLLAEDYLSGYLSSDEKFRQDYNTLLSFTKTLNEKLHTHKILESQRSLLISAVLIALEDTAFRTSYDKKNTPKSLCNFLVQTVIEGLENSNITGEKLANLSTQFGFIKTDTSLSTHDKILKELINDIDLNVNQFIKTHQYFDVLGQLYIEFLRYANSDKGLGIVLTPPHITELFTELAQVNKNSIVFDNCTGTGGFLISAMKQMVEDAKGDKNKISEIKSKQLIGVEYQAHIFALAVSNMYIHQDGKTNIINGSCFDNKVMERVKSENPNIGFLNPPYKGDKKNDIDELLFIKNNLDCLTDGGICIAIVPMQTALANTGKILEYKKEILSKHTLEAVLSMPDELFFNSKVGVVTCTMIFTAHKKHLTNKETFFGYCKDDGFVKRKIHGRIDAYGKWDKIKEKWITAFLNRKDIPGFSVNKVVGAEEEWCAEAYMETDYSTLRNEDFEDTILLYVTYLLSNKIELDIKRTPFSEVKLELCLNNWQLFALEDLFYIKGSKTTPLLELEEFGKGKYPFVTTQATNNGVTDFFDYYTEQGGILVLDSAVVGYCSYQSMDFAASDHVEKLIPKFNMNKWIAMFLTTIINKEQYRYNYGRKASQTRIKKGFIKLPSKDKKPDWQYMEDYIKTHPYSQSIC